MNPHCNAIFNDTIYSVIYLAEAQGVPLSRTTVRTTFLQHPNYPRLSLNDIHQTLQQWKLNPGIAKIDLETLRALPLPVIIHHTGCGTQGIFVVVTDIYENAIDFVVPTLGVVHQSMEQFLQYWAGIAMIFDPADDAGEPDYELMRQKEEADKAVYNDTIRIIDDYLSPDDCDRIISYCETNGIFGRSGIISLDEAESDFSNVRTSSSAALTGTENLFSDIYNRAAATLGIPAGHIEYLQCVKYEANQYYGVHYDADDKLPRLYTMLVYLNDDFEGGETWFSELGRRVKPKKGRALIFTNIDEQGDQLFYSAHAGLPVSKGVKYAVNVWVNTSPVRKDEVVMSAADAAVS
jgi:2OG-Fe(II) oxygenase superfamily/Peptidase C39 family